MSPLNRRSPTSARVATLAPVCATAASGAGLPGRAAWLSQVTERGGVADELGVMIRLLPNQVVVGVVGEVDMVTAPDLGCLLGALVDRGHTDVVLDLANLAFLDSSGLQMIDDTAARLRPSGGALRLRSLSARTRWLLDVSKVSGLVEFWSPLWRRRRSAGPMVPACRLLVMAGWGRWRRPTKRGPRPVRHWAGCLAAAGEGHWFHVESVGEEARWPDFVPRARVGGIGSILSSPLVAAAGRSVGALNIYSRTERAFGPPEQELAALFATQASRIVASGGVADEQASRLQAALRGREVIAQAQGVVMAPPRGIGRRWPTPVSSAPRVRPTSGFGARRPRSRLRPNGRFR